MTAPRDPARTVQRGYGKGEEGGGTTLFKKKPWRSEKYRRFVASLPCAVCGTPGANAHHEQLNGGKMGGKESDEFCIPLCPWHHFYRHNSPLGKKVWETWGKDPEKIIRQTQAEWVRRGNKAEWQQ